MISVIICLEQSIPCELCAIKFTRKPNLNIQMRSLHDIISNTCMYWQKHFLQPSQLSEHFVASLLITLEVAQLFYQLYFLHVQKLQKLGWFFNMRSGTWWSDMEWPFGRSRIWTHMRSPWSTHMRPRRRICVVEDAYGRFCPVWTKCVFEGPKHATPSVS